MNGTDPYLKNFERFEKQTNQPAWLFPLRKAGIACFAEQGFPTLKDEDWRFTNVAPIANLPFKPMLDGAKDKSASEILSGAAFTKIGGSRLVFVNGHFASELSAIGKFPAGVKVSNLAAALTQESALVEKHLGRYAVGEGNAFAALNQAFFSDGAFIYLPKGVAVEEPIQLVFLSTAKQAGDTIHPRNLIIAEANSSATVLETYLSSGNAAYFTNAVTEIVAGDNARATRLHASSTYSVLRMDVYAFQPANGLGQSNITNTEELAQPT